MVFILLREKWHSEVIDYEKLCKIVGRKGEVNCRNIKLREFDVKIKADMIEEKGNCDQGLSRCFCKRQ